MNTDPIVALRTRRRAYIDYLLANAGTNQAKIARLCNTTQATVSRVIAGDRGGEAGSVAEQVWQAIAEATGFPVDHLMNPPAPAAGTESL